MKKKIKIAVVEDSIIDQAMLKTFIKPFILDKKFDSVIESFNDGTSFLQSKDTFDLIFLDMFLPDITGIDILKKLRSNNIKSEVVFCTSSKDFIEQSYEADAFHYLVKPINKTKIGSIINKYMDKYINNDTFEFHVQRGHKKILINNIVSIESSGHKCNLHTINSDIEVCQTISELTAKLEDFGFIKANRSTLINVKYIKDFSGTDITLVNNSYFSISRAKKKEIKEKILSYNGDK